MRPEGVVAWVLQRVTGAILILLLAVHFWLLHFKDVFEPIELAGVSLRLAKPLFLMVDVALLAAGLFHGLNGLRNVVLDLSISRSGRRWLGLTLWVVGLGFLFLGGLGLRAFLSG